MVGLFLVLRVFCVCPQPDVSEKISITVIKNYRVRAYAHFPAIGTSCTISHAWRQFHVSPCSTLVLSQFPLVHWVIDI